MPDTPAALDTYALALTTLAATPTSLTALLTGLSADLWTWSPAPGEWSLSETLAHMLDVETIIIPVRVRAMLANDGAAMPTPVEVAAKPATPEETLRAWQAARAANLDFLRTFAPDQLGRAGIHPRLGRITAREHIVEWAYHDLEHLRQMQATIEAALYPDIGGFHGLYSPPFPAAK